MNRQQISTAQALFFERDRIQALLEVVKSGKGFAVTITSTYQPDDVVASIQLPLRDHFQTKLDAIDEQIKLLGWSGE